MLTLTSRRSHFSHATRRTTLSDMFAVYRERRALARLDSHALKDIGLTRDEALHEARRPFWDVLS